MSGTSVVPYSAKKTTPKAAAVDNVNEIIDPMNFSFCNMENIDEIKEEEPRPSPRKTKAPLASSGKSKSKCLKLNNNSLNNLNTLVAAVSACFDQPSELGWLDLSMNDLPNIPDTLLDFPNIRILNLHGNQISDIKEVEKLSKLTHLRKLTLHGNPIDKQKGYRSAVLAYLPNLLELDFSGVTKADRKTSNTLSGFNKNKHCKKKINMDDED